MRSINILMYGLLLASTFMISSIAIAGDNSVNDAFDSLANSKGGSSKAAGLDAFDDLASGKGNADAGTGHGVAAGLKAMEANRAEQEAQAERLRRIRMEQEAKKQDEDMKADCYCVYNNCNNLIPMCIIYNDSHDSRYKRDSCSYDQSLAKAWNAAHAAEIEEENRRYWEAKHEKKRLCDAWKAAGPKANSESFKAQLRQQDQAISASQRASAEATRRRDDEIEADIKQRDAQDEQNKNALIAKLKAEEDAENAKQAARVAAEKAEAAKREAQLKEWCMTGNNMGYCSCWKWAPKTESKGCMK